MARVRLVYFAGIAELVGIGEEEIEIEDGTTLADLLFEILPSRHPSLGEFLKEAVSQRRYLVAVNGRSYTSLPGGLGHRLGDGDVISLFPPLGGG